MPGLLRKLFGKPSKKTAAPVKQEYRPPVPRTDKESVGRSKLQKADYGSGHAADKKCGIRRRSP